MDPCERLEVGRNMYDEPLILGPLVALYYDLRPRLPVRHAGTTSSAALSDLHYLPYLALEGQRNFNTNC